MASLFVAEKNVSLAIVDNDRDTILLKSDNIRRHCRLCVHEYLFESYKYTYIRVFNLNDTNIIQHENYLPVVMERAALNSTVQLPADSN